MIKNNLTLAAPPCCLLRTVLIEASIWVQPVPFVLFPRIDRNTESAHSVSTFLPGTGLAAPVFLAGWLLVRRWIRLWKHSSSSCSVCFQFDLIQIAKIIIVVVAVFYVVELMVICFKPAVITEAGIDDNGV